MINTVPALAEFLQRIDAAESIAIDTEADSLHCYFEKLCLIQISAAHEDALIDPLARMPLEPLFQVLAPKELVLHGADYDLRLLRRVGFAGPVSIFDTMIAARLTGHTEFSLAALLLKYFGVTLAKASQKANWAMRPLSPAMTRYAVNDTHYLMPLAGNLTGQLRAFDRWEWFRQSCERAMASAKIDRDRDRENAWRITGSSELRDRAAAILRALWLWRDAEAQAADKPPFHILQNEKLIEAAQRFDRGESVTVPHLSSSRRRRFFAAAEAALGSSPEMWPKPLRRPRPRITPEQERRFSQLKTRRDHAATALRLDASLIAPKATLENIAADPQNAPERLLLPWQRVLLEPIE